MKFNEFFSVFDIALDNDNLCLDFLDYFERLNTINIL